MAESQNDEFGRRMIYPTNTHPNRAKPFLLGKGDWAERRYNDVGDWNDMPISNDVNGDFIVTLDTSGHKGRMPVLGMRFDQYPFDDEGNHRLIHVVKDQSILRKRGFMSGSISDWKNVEITMYWRVQRTVGDPNAYKAMGFSARGGPHHSEGGLFGISPCWGTALYVALNIKGEPIVAKELGHGPVAGIRIGSVFGGNIMNKWVGMKGVFYNKANGNPYIELWLDRQANNNWELVLSYEDTGRWFVVDNNGNFVNNDCGGVRGEAITWGGPGVIFKLDRITLVEMKWASVREILPPEGWPVRYLLNARKGYTDFSMRALAQEYRLIEPISLRKLTELESELYPFD
jgi:hypothetical protein